LAALNFAITPEKDWPAVAEMFWPWTVMTGGAAATLAKLNTVAAALVVLS
jgi:hypothetical protein